MLTLSQAKDELLTLLRAKSVFHGDFKLSSGARSGYYVDCKLTTLDPKGAWLAAQVMHDLIRRQAAARGLRIDAVGGLTMGADPIALAIGLYSLLNGDSSPLQTFCVRKTPKAHGQTKLIEGNFKKGDTVVVVDDVVTRGESTLQAIRAVEDEGGRIAFVVVLVDRLEGGREKIEGKGYVVFSALDREEVLAPDAQPSEPADYVPARIG